MNDEQRRQAILFYEGQVLTSAGHGGVAQAAETAQCMIDGATNALVRLQGAAEASQFAFAVADRAVSGVRGPTAWPPEKPAADAGETQEVRKP
ncbi:MAG: hypothetical protein HXY30_09175 [Pseudorhodoplanes sp.]|nr:hypothetical protein [Pseudorhodoplanes sp.]